MRILSLTLFLLSWVANATPDCSASSLSALQRADCEKMGERKAGEEPCGARVDSTRQGKAVAKDKGPSGDGILDN